MTTAVKQLAAGAATLLLVLVLARSVGVDVGAVIALPFSVVSENWLWVLAVVVAYRVGQHRGKPSRVRRVPSRRAGAPDCYDND